jgi:hypothetical protein
LGLVLTMATTAALRCLQGSLECTVALLDAGTPLNGVTSFGEMSPLAVASQYGHSAIVSLLLERCAARVK